MTAHQQFIFGSGGVESRHATRQEEVSGERPAGMGAAGDNWCGGPNYLASQAKAGLCGDRRESQMMPVIAGQITKRAAGIDSGITRIGELPDPRAGVASGPLPNFHDATRTPRSVAL